ncbi:deoxyuridine triphosphatase [Pteropodid alphaherpesvirus 1]|uniref:Deoxyuridine triphosphatase n=1 Tax=Pteropodid alphaherpesvirus 1 TaxID=1343901 RepID=A0A060Q4Z9_9ALPH|nr:deoxyuridine triphosphatase [Pteropodid alphaherpesvirus 1]BAP00730.1 deoxyuridine triphosphatase [Pteropodid alphaherpesvirus 1]
MQRALANSVLVDTGSLADADTKRWRVTASTQGSVAQLTVTNQTPLCLCDPAPSTDGVWIGKISLDLRMAMPEHLCAVLHAHACHSPLFFVATGLIDSGYRGIVQAVVFFTQRVCEVAAGDMQFTISFFNVASIPLTLTAPVFFCPLLAKAQFDETAPARLIERRDSAGSGFVHYTGKLTEVPTPAGDYVDEAPAFLAKRSEDAGIDIVIHQALEIPPNSAITIQPSLRALRPDEGPEAYYILGRSSLNSKGAVVTPTRWLPQSQCLFTVRNITNAPIVLPAHSKVAQLLITAYPALVWVPANSGDRVFCTLPAPPVKLFESVDVQPPQIIFTSRFNRLAPPSQRGVGGFGSTGV